ncbi:PACE efflux transporter [Nitrosomonas sp. Is37]|uniref:PACE efflux transporter n=1 Tax=Nitrosomonas sp. Is37 TaxID=3080535 RepID=UPI00294B6AF7|nr:PACE efflux transporter [Nitrosomonas sp. Is37]MDV6344918.1 PACE efflux transporter [Nitrosomonas sp. Is37]
MQRTTRKIIQAILYEVIAVLLVTPFVVLIFDKSIGMSSLLAIVMSLIAVSWNYIFNSMFEYWETKQTQKGRSIRRRFLHAIGFEGGLVIFTVPLIAYWLELSLWAALIMDIGLLIFFFFYAIAFHWSFDKLFGLPESAQWSK